DTVDLLARHLYLGAAGPKAVHYLERAGTRAKRLFANDEAVVHLRRAAEVAGADPDSRARLPGILIDLGDLEKLRGEYDEAFELFDTAREATDDVRAWLGLADTLRNQGAHDNALRVLDDAFAAVDWSDDERARLWLERSWILAVAGRHAETIESALAGLQALHAHAGPVAGQLLLPLSRAEQMEGKLD